MRVLHFHSGKGFGGIQIMLETLAAYRHLTPEISHEFALCFEGRCVDRLRATGATVHMLCPVRTSHPWQVIRARALIRLLLNRERFDAVIFHSTWGLALFAGLVRRLGPEVIFWMHNNATETSRRNLLERIAAVTDPKLVICNSRFTAASLPTQFRRPPVHRVLPCPVPAPEPPPGARESLRRELGLAPDTCMILQLSRIERWKGLTLLIGALGLLAEDPGWECVVAGGAQTSEQQQYLRELQAQTERSGISRRVRFLGHRDDVPALLAAADIFCQPNRDPEPFGISFVEALFAGLPIVSINHGGIAEIADSGCARLLTPPGSPEILAAAMSELIGHPETRHALAGNATARATAYLPEKILPQLAEILSGVARSTAVFSES